MSELKNLTEEEERDLFLQEAGLTKKQADYALKIFDRTEGYSDFCRVFVRRFPRIKDKYRVAGDAFTFAQDANHPDHIHLFY